MHELLDRPFLVSTSRHVASPAFDVADVEWAASGLEGESKVVAGDRYELRFYVPAGWKAMSGSVKSGSEWQAAELEAKGRSSRISFTPEKTGTVRWRVVFKKDKGEN